MTAITECCYNTSVYPINLSCEVLNARYSDINLPDEDFCRIFDEIDPDANFYNLAANNCKYFSESSLNSHSPSPGPNLNILHHNIRSANKNLNYLLNHLDLINLEFSIIGLTETWCTEYNAHLISIRGYNHSYQVRTQNSHGGVSIFVKENIHYIDRKDLYNLSPSLECIFIEIPKKHANGKDDIIIGVIYRPPSGNTNEFLLSLESILDTIKNEKKPCYLLGDYNINLLASNTNRDEFENLMFSYAFLPLIDKPTRVTKKSATLIDNIYTNQPTNQQQPDLSGILVNDVSDHFPIFTSTNIIVKCSSQKFLKRRKYSQNNINAFKLMLRNHDWSHIFLETNCQIAYNKFLSDFQKLYENAFPHTNSSTYQERKSWLPPELIAKIKVKNKLYQKYLKKPSVNNYNYYKTYRNVLNRQIREAEKEHYARLLNQNMNNPRKSWQVIKEIINKKTLNNSMHEFHTNEAPISEPETIANHFNEFFTNIGPKLAEQIPISSKIPTSFIQCSVRDSISIDPTNNTEVLNVLKAIKTSSEGWDSLSTQPLKQCYELITPLLTHIINLSLSQGTVPLEFKKAVVLPVFKKDDKREFTNYRPISILPLFSKVIEKIMYKRIYNFLSIHNLLYDYQFGFRQKYGTNLALLQLCDKISESLKLNETVIGVFLDFSKAFDTIDHSILLLKLEKYGIRGIANQWLKSYLENRTQTVKYNDTMSKNLPIKCGVPQGSILGPLLFLIYINDLSCVSKKLFTILFADDTNIFISGKNLVELEGILNEELNNLVEWLHCNRLSLNISKTHYMIFSKMPIDRSLKILISNQVIQRVKSTKFLGITIDEALDWKPHINNIRLKTSKSIGILCKCRKLLDKKILLQLYHAFVSPYLSYGIELWGSATKSALQPIIINQKRSLRIIHGAPPRSPSTPLFLSSEVLPLDSIYEFKILEFMFKYNNFMLPGIFRSMFTLNANVHNHDTRQRHLIHHAQTSTTAYSKSIRYTGISLWNDLHQDIRNSTSPGLFKNKLKIYLLKKMLPP